MVQEARDKGNVIDATCGRKTRAVLIMDSGSIILSAIQPETISARTTNRSIADEDTKDIENMQEDKTRKENENGFREYRI